MLKNMKVNIFLSICLCVFLYSNVESFAGGHGRAQVSPYVVRIADAYNRHLQKRALKPAPPPPPPPPTKPPSPASPKPTTVQTIAVINITSKPVTTCPFSQNLACSSTNKYQTFDGSCNNLVQSAYGAVNTPYKRFLTPQYGDGANSPRTLSVTGAALPNPRKISTTLFKDIFQSERIWFHLFTTFGQFITHDMTSVAPSSG